ncbi:hypothetical protein KGQ72_02670 [Patescibacteria group bacterium]|nr:hypothetical protein [Patescibacteria group bacterium]
MTEKGRGQINYPPGKDKDEDKTPKNGAMAEALGRARIKKIEDLLAHPPAEESPAPPEILPDVPATPPVETGEPKTIPPELQAVFREVPPKVMEKYAGITDPKKRERYVENVRIAQQKQAERESRERDKNKKPVKHRTQKPKTQSPEKIEEVARRMKEETAEELRRMAAARTIALKPSGAAPDAPTIKMSVDAIRSDMDGKPNPDEDEEYPAVWRYNRDRRGNTEARGEPPSSGPEPSSTEAWQWPKSERTPAEERNFLRKLIEGAKEKFEWWKSSKEGLIRRNKELDAQAEKIPGVEKLFRTWGETYNKFGWKTKLAVGAGLGLGAVVTAGSLPMVIPLFGIAAQRIAGLSTMYLKFEKNSHDQAWGRNKEWGKQKAMLKAGFYTVLMSIAIKEAIEYASETEIANAAQAKIEGWLGSMLGHHATPPAGASEAQHPAAAAPPAPHAPTAPIAPEHSAIAAGHQASADVQASAPGIDHSVAVSNAGGAAASAPAFEMPTVGASSHGYEGMLKNLLKQLPDTKPDGIPDGSDLAKLYEAKANPGLLEKTVYELAKGHKFLVDGESVRIDPTAHMTIVGGQLHLTDATHPAGVFDAASNMHILHPHADVHFTSASQAPRAEVPAPEAIPVPPAPAEVDLTAAQHLAEEKLAAPVVPPPVSEQPPVWHTGSGGVLTDGSGNPVHAGEYGQPPPAAHIEAAQTPFVSPPEAPAPEAPNAPEAPATLAPEAPKIIHEELPAQEIKSPETVQEVNLVPGQDAHPMVSEAAPASAAEAVNQFGIKVPLNEPHIYADSGATHLFVYGGSPVERSKAVLEYLVRNPDKVVFAPDDSGKYRIPWHLVEGKIVPGAPMRTSGFFGWLSSFMKPPGPEEFEKVIK